MLWLFVPGVVIPVTLLYPRVAVFVWALCVHLRVMGPALRSRRLRNLGEINTRLERLVEARPGTKLSRRYYGWAFCHVVLFAMAATVYASDWTENSGRILWAYIAGVILATCYSPFYHDASEITGRWTSEAFRSARVWGVLQAYFNVDCIYMHKPNKTLEKRDVFQKRLTKQGYDEGYVMKHLNQMDKHALLKARHEPRSMFTSRMDEYTRTISGGSGLSRVGRRSRVYACHPHGITATGAALLGLMYGAAPLLPDTENIRTCVANVLFAVPIIREWVLLCGCIDASSEAIAHNLAQGHDIMLLPGGMLEQSITRHDRMDIVWDRVSFCNLALEYQASIIPICVFGEPSIFWCKNVFPGWRLKNYRRFGYAFPWVFVGPFPSTLTVAIGRPIDTRPAYPDDEVPSLVGKAEIASKLDANGAIDLTRTVSDYTGDGYADTDETRACVVNGYITYQNRGKKKRSREYTTLMNQSLDENARWRVECIAGIHREVYTQFVDLRDLAAQAVTRFYPDAHVEPPGDSYILLREQIDRNTDSRMLSI